MAGILGADGNGTNYNPDDNIILNDNVILYAKWIIDEYTVTFESNGGTPIDSQIVSAGSLATRPDNPIREEYTFEGWYTDNGTFLDEWDFNTIVTKNITLYARWIIDEYTVTFESNGGTPVGSQIVSAGSPATRPDNPIREEYTFEGWYTDNVTFLNEWDFSTIVTKNITLYARWILEECIVTFESNGGTPVEQQIVPFDLRVTKPEDPSKQGYAFSGWYTDNVTFQDEWDFNTIVTKNMTLYARWMANEYIVTFESNGGTPVEQQIVPFDLRVTKPGDPTKRDYAFSGWYTDNGTFQDEWDFDTMVTKSMTLYARWLADDYTVTFESNGGTLVDNQIIPEGELATRPNDPTKHGYIFEGWYTDNGTFLNEWDFNTPITEDITLYAKWRVDFNLILMWILIIISIILLLMIIFWRVIMEVIKCIICKIRRYKKCSRCKCKCKR